MKKKNLYLLGLPVLALILELLPWGVVMRFANPDGDPWILKTSYFSLLPFGYANVGPLFTAVLTCGLLILLAFCLAKENRALLKTGAVISAAAMAVSFLPVSVLSYSLIGGMISLCLAAETLVLLWKVKNIKDSCPEK